MAKSTDREKLAKIQANVEKIGKELRDFDAIIKLAGDDKSIKAKLDAIQARYAEDVQYLVDSRARLVGKMLSEDSIKMNEIIATLLS